MAEIKDDILISQTVEILEPVLKDSRSRGESPALDVEDLEDDEKETKGARESGRRRGEGFALGKAGSGLSFLQRTNL